MKITLMEINGGKKKKKILITISVLIQQTIF